MKRVVYGLALIIGMASSTSAMAAWCRAQSPVAWGEGVGYTVDEACYIALRQCAARTPAGYSCFVVDYAF